MERYVALASDAYEFGAIAGFSEEHRDNKVLCIYYDHWVRKDAVPENVELERASRITGRTGFLSQAEVDTVDERALFFARNWYNFDESFGQAITFDGINLGFVTQQAFFNIFKDIFVFLASISKFVRENEDPVIVVVKGSFSGACGKVAADSLGAKLIELNPKDEGRKHFGTPFRAKKVQELAGKFFNILRTELGLQNKRNARTVFVKGNRFLGNLLKEIEKDPALKAVSLDNAVLKSMLNPLNIYRYKSVMSEKGKLFERLYSKYCKSSQFLKNMRFEGIGFGAAFSSRMPRFTMRDWPEFIFVIGVMTEEFKRHRPHAVVLWEDAIPVERICALLASKFGARSIVAQHGQFEPDTNLKDWIRGFVPLTADVIAVWGERFRKMMVERGVSPSRAIVTGAPRFDFFKKNRLYAERARKKLGVAPGEKLVVVASGKDFSRRELEAVWGGTEAMGKKVGLKVVFRPHPTESVELYSWMKGKAAVIRDMDLRGLLSAADAVIVKLSTVGFEAIILDTPVIVFGDKLWIENPFRSTDAVLRAGSSKELEAALGVSFDEVKKGELRKKMEKFVFDSSFRQDGNASKRVVELVKRDSWPVRH